MGFPRVRSLETMVWFMLLFVITCMLYSLNGLHQQAEPRYANVQQQQHQRQPRALPPDDQTPKRPVSGKTSTRPQVIQRHSHVSLESGVVSMDNKHHGDGGAAYHAAILPDEDTPSKHHAAMLEEIDGFNYFVEWEHKLEQKNPKLNQPNQPVIYKDNLPNSYNSPQRQSNDQTSRSKRGFAGPQPRAMPPTTGSDSQRRPNVIARGGGNSYPMAPGYRTEKRTLARKQDAQGSVVKDGQAMDQPWVVAEDRPSDGTNVVQGIQAPGHVAPLPGIKDVLAPRDERLLGPVHPNPEMYPRGQSAFLQGSGVVVEPDEEVIKPLPLEQANWTLEEIERGARLASTAAGGDQPRAVNHPLLYNLLNDSAWRGLQHGDSSDLVQSMAQRAPLPKVKHRVYVEMMGRLGNNMFQFASLYGIARSTRRIPALPIIDNQLLDVFHLDIMKHASFETMPLGITQMHEERSGIYTPQLLYLPPRDVTVCCYLQSWKYFRDYSKDLRRIFTFKDWVEMRAQRYLSVITRNYLSTDHFGHHRLTYVGVHIRRSDYITQEHIARGYKPATVNYLHKAMDYFRQKYPNVYFIACSDEIEWAKQHIRAYDVHFVEEQGSTMDLALLTHCNHTIITVGSYGWWAGWLAGGDVLYYKDWPAPGTEIGSSYKHEDYFPPHWKGIGG